jgi:hypothetical protein
MFFIFSFKEAFLLLPAAKLTRGNAGPLSNCNEQAYIGDEPLLKWDEYHDS